MARTHFEKELQVGNRKMKAPGREDFAALRKDEPLARSTIVLTPELIYGFVQKYLAYKYDNRVPTPAFHMEMWADCCDEAYTHVIELAPRGHAKSTAITEAYGLAAMLFRVRDYAVIISNTFDQAVEFLRDITTELTDNDALREDFGVKRLVKGSEDDIIVEMRDGHRFRMVARGSEQKIRGRKWNKKRPNLILFDDLEDDEQVVTKERREKFQRWFMNAVLPAGSRDCLFRGAATILHFDSLAENLSKDPEWKCRRFKAHRGFDDFTNILWPEAFNEAALRKIRQKYINRGNRDGYSQEYLNNPIAEGESYFREADLIPMREGDYKSTKRNYASWDFAISQKQTADYTVCVVVGVDSTGSRHVIDVRRARWASDEIIEEMFAVQKAHNCVCHYAEAGQIEKTLAPFIYAKMATTDFYFNIETRIPVLDKVSRATAWRAATRARQVRYDHRADWWPALLEEMTRFPKGVHDDQVDPQSLLGLEWEGGLQAATSADDQDEEDYRDMLRAAGVSHHEEGRSAVTGY